MARSARSTRTGFQSKTSQFFDSFFTPFSLLILVAALLFYSCDPEGSSSSVAPPRFTLAQNDDGRTFTLTIGEGVKTIARGEFASATILKFGLERIELNTKLAGKLGANPKGAITAIVLPSTLETIDDYALADHRGVKERLVVPKRVRTIGTRSFTALGNNSSSIEFEEPSQLKAIGSRAFSEAFTSVLKLPESLEIIGERAFIDLKGFTINTFTIPGNIKRIGKMAFLSASGNPKITGTLAIASLHLTKPNLGDNLFVPAWSTSSNFTAIQLHQAVYDSYTKADLQAIFGPGTITYQNLTAPPMRPSHSAQTQIGFQAVARYGSNSSMPTPLPPKVALFPTL